MNATQKAGLNLVRRYLGAPVDYMPTLEQAQAAHTATVQGYFFCQFQSDELSAAEITAFITWLNLPTRKPASYYLAIIQTLLSTQETRTA